MKDILIAERYRIERKIGAGGFGVVYSGTDLVSREEVAIKLIFMGDWDNSQLLRLEKDIYDELSGGVGIPRVRWFGLECDYYALVQDMLGPSLEDLLSYCGGKFSLKTILLIADQAISRIQYIHSKGFLHRDIKPGNFLMGVGRHGNTLHATDFGLSRAYSDAEYWKDVQTLPFLGTRQYASISTHSGRQQSWRDDLECLGYVLLYFARGSLPWQDLKAATQGEQDMQIKELKANLSAEELCDGFLPKEFATYINYARGLGFEDKPNYHFLRKLFRRLFQSKGFKYDNVFDWTQRLFDEMQSKLGPTAPWVSNPE